MVTIVCESSFRNYAARQRLALARIELTVQRRTCNIQMLTRYSWKRALSGTRGNRPYFFGAGPRESEAGAAVTVVVNDGAAGGQSFALKAHAGFSKRAQSDLHRDHAW